MLLKLQNQNILNQYLYRKKGGLIRDYADYSLIINSDNAARIQELHNLISHIICEIVKMILMKNNKILKEWKKFHTIILISMEFSQNKVYVDQTGKETIRCDRADGLAFDILENLKINIYGKLNILFCLKNKIQ